MGHCFLTLRHRFPTGVECQLSYHHTLLILSFVPRFEVWEGSKVNLCLKSFPKKYMINYTHNMGCNNYKNVSPFFLFFFFNMNLPAAGFSAPHLSAPRAHLCQSLILESLLPKKQRETKKRHEIKILLFKLLTCVGWRRCSKCGLLTNLSLTVKSLFTLLCGVIQRRERKCARCDPACDATWQEFGCGHAIEILALWCESLLSFKDHPRCFYRRS